VWTTQHLSLGLEQAKTRQLDTLLETARLPPRSTNLTWPEPQIIRKLVRLLKARRRTWHSAALRPRAHRSSLQFWHQLNIFPDVTDSAALVTAMIFDIAGPCCQIWEVRVCMYRASRGYNVWMCTMDGTVSH
jgi:hypothetical protein